MANKWFMLRRDQIKPLAEGYGTCFATDMIVVDGNKVGYMYGEEADNDVDSGWRFMSGRESDEYMHDAANHGVYDVNTVANYDPDIIPLLDAPIGSAFARDPRSGQFVTGRARVRGVEAGTLEETTDGAAGPALAAIPDGSSAHDVTKVWALDPRK
jgi:hypothetical protein